MFGLQILDIAIGLIFIYLILALICTAAKELIAGLLHSRANNLQIGIRNLLEGDGVKLKDPKDQKEKGLMDLLYAHPLIGALHENRKKPSYIPSRTFALALLDVIAPANPDSVRTIEHLRKAIKDNLPANSDLRRSLLVLIDEAGAELEKLQDNIEIWFNNAMDRVSGWYKQKSQWIILFLAMVFTAISNADTIQIARTLSNDPALREALVAQAQEFAKAEPAAASPAESIKENIDKLQNLGISLGWKNGVQELGAGKIFGLLLTALAVSLGAPFWFDVLNKVITIRAAGKSPKEMAKPPEAPPKRREEVPPK